MFYRALHTISTSRYRLSARRFIFDLFDIALDQDTAQQLVDSARTLALGPAKPQISAGRRRAMSVLFAAPKQHASGSDEEEEGTHVTNRAGTKRSNLPPELCLRPRDTIVGFGDVPEASP
jgi:rapamycin-insensitive companion of mTOR